MAITKVRVQIDGVWTNLSKGSNGKWTGTLTAPATTSYNLANKYYPVKVEVTNDAGTVVTKDATDATLGELLRLVVKETTSITLSVKLDTTVPVLSGITLAPNPANASASVAITVEVS